MFPKNKEVNVTPLSKLLCSVAGISLFLGLIIYCVFYINPDTGARILTSGNKNYIYDLNYQYEVQKQVLDYDYHEVLPYRNLPTLALPFAVLGSFSLRQSYQIYFIINLTTLVFVVFLFQRWLKIGFSAYHYLLVLSFLPAFVTLFYGQVTIFFLLLFLVIYKLISEDKHFWAGLVVSLFVNRFQYLVSLPILFLISQRKAKFLKGFLLGTFLLLLLSFILVGFDNLVKYPSFILQTESVAFGSGLGDFSTLFSFFYTIVDYFKLPSSYAYILNFVLYALFILLFSKRIKRLDLSVAFSICVLSTLSFSVHAWDHDLVLILLSIFLLLGYFRGTFNKHNKKKTFYIILVISVVILYFSCLLSRLSYPFIASFISIFLAIYLLNQTWLGKRFS
jgi:hypothetical protein